MREIKITEGKYANVNALNMHYEIHGTGWPLVLLHGALSAIGTSFGKLLPVLSKSQQVITIEQQAHGHTAGIDRPLTINQMADDMVALLKQFDIKEAGIFGYSMRADIALHIAIKYPYMIRKLVVASVTYNNNEFIAGLIAWMENLKLENMTVTATWQEESAQIAPNPEDWPTLVTKMKQLNLHLPGIQAEVIQSIKASWSL